MARAVVFARRFCARAARESALAVKCGECQVGIFSRFAKKGGESEVINIDLSVVRVGHEYNEYQFM